MFSAYLKTGSALQLVWVRVVSLCRSTEGFRNEFSGLLHMSVFVQRILVAVQMALRLCEKQVKTVSSGRKIVVTNRDV